MAPTQHSTTIRAPDGSSTGCPVGYTCTNTGDERPFCCPPGTEALGTFNFTGCCPDTDLCGCQGDLDRYEQLCPLSRRSAKTAIRYLTPADIEAARNRLLSVQLASYEYRRAPGPRHLGFIIDDLDEATARVCVAPDGEHVDLYGYASLAVAAVQAQQREIDELRRQVAKLRRSIDGRNARP
jgi:hypothetical protein